MAKEGSVAPTARVNLVCKVDTGGQKAEKELPCKVMILADIRGREDTTPLAKREPIKIDKDNFKEIMGKQDLALSFNVPNRLSGKPDEKMEVNLRVKDLDGFHPDSLIDQVGDLQAVYKIRQALTELRGNLIQNKDFRKKLEDLLGMLSKDNDPQRKSQILDDIGVGPAPGAKD